MEIIRNRLIEKFSDPEYAHGYMHSHAVSTIAAQIYWTRQSRQWTQEDLAERSGMAQERISKIESGDFTSLTMKTLNKLADALDVNLRIEFEPFSNAIYNACHQTKKSFELPERTASLAAMRHECVVVANMYGNVAVTSGVGTGSNSLTTAAPTRASPAQVVRSGQALQLESV
jgi:transcriptional regulator with XRE-family HTH domain